MGLAGGGELAKLLQLREAAGELAATDERRFRALSRATERELLQARPCDIGRAPMGGCPNLCTSRLTWPLPCA